MMRQFDLDPFELVVEPHIIKYFWQLITSEKYHTILLRQPLYLLALLS